ncbi:MAG TPA: hypothetical protein VN681_11245 [Stellaceae bacterium]|nr:hypothetical protein [Stellaceae bacterium]
MFDFDVVTGPTNPTRPAKPAAPPKAKPLTSPSPSGAAAAMRDGGRVAERSTAELAGAHP